MADEDVTISIEEGYREYLLWELDLTDELLLDIPDFRKAVHAARYEEVLLWKDLQIVHLPVVIERSVRPDEHQVVEILIILEELAFAGLKRHEQAVVHRYDLVKRPVHLIEAQNLCAEVLEAPQANVHLLANCNELLSFGHFDNSCDGSAVEKEAGIDLVDFIDCEEDHRALGQAEDKESVQQLSWVFLHLLVVSFFDVLIVSS